MPSAATVAFQMVDNGASNPVALANALRTACMENDEAAARILWEHLGEVLNVGWGYSLNSKHVFGVDWQHCLESWTKELNN